MPPLPPEANFRPQRPSIPTAFAPPQAPPPTSGLFRMFPPGAPRMNPFLAAAAMQQQVRPYQTGGSPLPPRPPRPYGIL